MMFFIKPQNIAGTETPCITGSVIRYNPMLSVVPYFPENLTLYLKNNPFPKNSQNLVSYIRPLPVPYRHPLNVPYNAPSL